MDHPQSALAVSVEALANLLEASISGGAPKDEAPELKPSARNGTSAQDTHGRGGRGCPLRPEWACRKRHRWRFPGSH